MCTVMAVESSQIIIVCSKPFEYLKVANLFKDDVWLIADHFVLLLWAKILSTVMDV